jgi:deazaflavin-dependent oxidoreductase (nitroreductase family)
MRRVNRVFTNRLTGTFAWLVPPLAVVYHRGRKSGRRYRTPVVAFPTETGFVIPMTYGRDVDWGRNIVATGECELGHLGRRVKLHHPRVVGSRAALPHLPRALRPLLQVADFPGYVLLERETKHPRKKRAARRA